MVRSDRETIASTEAEFQQTTNLSEKEAAVAARKLYGRTHQEIANELNIKKGTVDSHSHRARKKYSLAFHTSRQLEQVFGNSIPNPRETSGVVFFYDGTDATQNTYLLPAAHAAANDDGNSFVTVNVSDARHIPDKHGVDKIPAYVHYEGEPVEAWTGDDVWDAVDTQIAEQIGQRTGAFDPNDGWKE